MTGSTIMFGDIEPEDSWHPDDPAPELVENLRRRVELLTRRRQVLTGSSAEILEKIAVLVAKARRRRLTGRDLVRADQLDEDIAYVRSTI